MLASRKPGMKIETKKSEMVAIKLFCYIYNDETTMTMTIIIIILLTYFLLLLFRNTGR